MSRTRATLSHFEDNDRILMAQVPVGRVETVYSRIGDALPIACGLVVLTAIGVLLRRRTTQAEASLMSHDRWETRVHDLDEWNKTRRRVQRSGYNSVHEVRCDGIETCS